MRRYESSIPGDQGSLKFPCKGEKTLLWNVGSRNKLLAISADNENYRETGKDRSDTEIINDAERMFQLTFSEEEIPLENFQNNNIRTCSVFSPISLCNTSKVSC